MMPHLLAALLATGAAAPPAQSPGPDPAELRRSCRDDAFRLCPGQVALARRDGVKRCLAANRAKLSPVCRTAFPGD
jgi:hypothetical protein